MRTDWQNHVLEEKVVLDARIATLRAFMEGEVYITLPPYDQGLLNKQRSLMEQYSAVLGDRITRFEENDNEQTEGIKGCVSD